MHWQLQQKDQIATLTLDVVDKSANTLTQEVLRELDQHLNNLKTQPLEGLIIQSGKAKNFIVGADVNEFTRIDDAEQATELAHTGQQVFNRIETLPFPSVAIINGHCLGGGMELALACDYRLALDNDATRMGLPEVRLGIHPGFGGTVRLPRIVGLPAALDMMLTGRGLRVRAARRIGLVNEVVPQRYLKPAALALLAKGRARRKLPLLTRLGGLWPLRNLVFSMTMRKLRQRVNFDHYPAPLQIMQLVKQRARDCDEAGSLGELLVGRTSRNLVHVFLLGEQQKRYGRQQQHGVNHVHVIGAGVMGGDIAAWSAMKGFRVSLQDRDAENLARAMQRAYKLFQMRLKNDRLVQEAMDRLMPDLNGSGLGRAELVIEAIVENVEAKTSLLRDVEKKVRPETIIATNTSSIPLETLAKALQRPSQLVGLHFFNPVAKMQLIEVVHGKQSDADCLARARAFSVALDRLPLDVNSSPGFLVNRILMPYLIEAMAMAEEGVPLAAIDKAATQYGMPMGPILLADTVGLDICLSVAEVLSKPLGIPVPDGLRKMVDQGLLGKKSGRGFYKYDKNGRARIPSAKRSDAPITERLVLRILNEAVACLREGVIDDADAVDIGMVYGTGFAPYLGGPMRYVESLGETGIRHSLYRLSQEYGKRFEPDEGWNRPELLVRGRNE